MTDVEKIDYSIQVFTALLSEKQDRLTRGLILRQAMHEAIARGEEPKGYRPDWITEQSAELVKHLVKVAEAFDATHPDDKASVGDILDILATVAGQFRAKMKG